MTATTLTVYTTTNETDAFKEWLETQGPNPGNGLNGRLGWRSMKQKEYEKLFGIPAEETKICDVREKLSFSEWLKSQGI